MWHVHSSRQELDRTLFGRRYSKSQEATIYAAFRTRRLYSVLAFLLLVAIGVLITGCGSNPSSAPESNSPSTLSPQSTLTSNPTAPPEMTPTSLVNTGCTAQPNIICGRLVDGQGMALTNAIIQIEGVSNDGENVQYIPPVAQDGTYSVQVATGFYKVSAYAQATYQGAMWQLALHPDDNSNRGLPSVNGIVKNFTWLLTGTIPDENPSNFLSHYGAAINVTASGQTLDQDIPQGSNLHFTLTPQGPLIDGSTGQTLTFDRTVEVASSLNDSFLEDIPLAVYTIAVSGTTPDGNSLNLSINTQTIVFSNNEFSGEQSLFVTCSC